MPKLLITAITLCLSLSGCLVFDDDFYSHYYDPVQPTYGTCFDDNDCRIDNFCQPMALDFGDFVYENAICTSACIGDGPSVDCEIGFTGEHGSCYSNEIVSALDATPVCFERCHTSDDCLTGFVCLNHEQLPGLLAGDAICVPGP